MEHIAKILTDPAFLGSLPMVALLAVTAFVLVKTNVLRVKTEHVQLGGTLQESKEAYYERTIVRSQISNAHDYVKSLGQEALMLTDREMRYGGYCVKYVLERVFDKAVEWVTFNHIEDSEAYVTCKQDEVTSLVKALYADVFEYSDELDEKLREWTKELVRRLVAIRKMYQKQLKEER